MRIGTSLSLVNFMKHRILISDQWDSSVPEDVVQALGRLHDAISSRIGPDVVAISQLNLLQDVESWLYVDIANLWYTCLCLRKWSYNGTVPRVYIKFY